MDNFEKGAVWLIPIVDYFNGDASNESGTLGISQVGICHSESLAIVA